MQLFLTKKKNKKRLKEHNEDNCLGRVKSETTNLFMTFKLGVNAKRGWGYTLL